MIRWLTLLPALLLAAGVQAQVNRPHNELGIYTVETPDGCAAAQADAPAGTSFACYVVLTNPWNDALDRPVTEVGGYEFRLEMPADVLLLGAVSPPQSTGELYPPDMLMGCRAPVVDGCCTLLDLVLMPVSDGPYLLSLTPVQDAPQSIPGAMNFTDFNDGDAMQVMHPVSGSADVPVFAINWDGALSFCETVPGDNASFGAVKALYR